MIHLLEKLHLEDIQNSNHPSIFIKEDDYNVFIIRLPSGEGTLEVASLRFIMYEDKVFIYDDSINDLKELGDGFESLYRIVDKMTDDFMKSIDYYIDQTTNFEESLFDRSFSSDFIENWFLIKKDLNRIERFFIPALKATDELINFYKDKYDFHEVSFLDIKEHLERSQRFCLLNINKMDEIYAFHASLKSEQMNRILFILAIVSTVFLPLNFIVSFFGINTGGLFFSNDPDGTVSVIVLLAATAFITVPILYILHKKIFS